MPAPPPALEEPRPDAAGDEDAPPDDAPEPDDAGPELAAQDLDPAARNVNTPPDDASNRDARRREAEEDRELIGRAQKGDNAAFRRLVERHQRRAFTLALNLVRDQNDAHEIVQEAFLRVYRGLQSFQGGSSFYTWLYRIVTNLSIDLIRKPGRKDAELVEGQKLDENTEFPLVSRIDGADPINVLRRREIAARIQAALDALPPIHRGVILLREVEGMSYEEMAQAMGVSKGTIMSRLFHARQKLQRALADCYAEEGPARGRRTSGDDEAAAEEEEGVAPGPLRRGRPKSPEDRA